MSYQTQLAGPEWLNFADWIRSTHGKFCDVCRRGDVVLQVHHKFYTYDRKPWEYSYDEMMVLCRECHKAIHEELNIFRRSVMGSFKPNEFRLLNAALKVAMEVYDPLTFTHALVEFVQNPSLLRRYAESYGRQTAFKSKPEPTYNATERDYDERGNKP